MRKIACTDMAEDMVENPIAYCFVAIDRDGEYVVMESWLNNQGKQELLETIRMAADEIQTS